MIMVWGYIQYGDASEICKVDGNIDSTKYQQILASQYIPNYYFFQKMQHFSKKVRQLDIFWCCKTWI